ncbi:MAG: DegV family protein [Christensenellaceae bacterium]|nr:DegV family protein [Christensenellaceae bacterium]
MYQITCCSTADMPQSFFDDRNIKYVMFHYLIDGKEYPDDLGKTMSFDDFYSRIKAGAMPTTSQVNVEQYIEMFKPILEEGKDIIHISLSSGISGSYNSALIAQENMQKKFPERKIYVVDSLAASSGYGLLVTLAADKRDEGMGVDDLYNWIEENKLNIHHWFFTDDLTHFKRGGRVSATSAVLGNLLNICPLLNVSNEGKLIPREKIRGTKKVIKEMFKKMQTHVADGTDYNSYCYISNSSRQEISKELASMIEAEFPKLNAKVMINSVGTVIGAHTGPGTVALFFVGDKRID